jgi:hypothetical protein
LVEVVTFAIRAPLRHLFHNPILAIGPTRFSLIAVSRYCDF